jgi:hypothetical protein
MEISKQELPEDYKEYIKAKKEYNKRIIKQIKKKKGKENGRKIKIKCVNCNRGVGMIFNEDGITFEAKCGDKKRPCKLNIKATLPKYTRVLERIKEIQKELNTILGELKNIKVRILYTQEVEKDDPKRFNSLKKHAISLLKENRDLHRVIPNYPHKIEEVGVQPDKFFDRLKFYEEHKKELQDYYIFDRPKMSQKSNSEFVFADEDDNITTLISNLDFLVKED